MSETPTPLQPVTVAFDNSAKEAELMRVKEKIEELSRELPGLDDTIFNICVGMALVPPTGWMTATACYAAYRGTLFLLPPLIQAFNDLCQWVWAPQNIVDMADALLPVYNHGTNCKQALVRQAMPADKYWMGPAVEAYYGHIELHTKASGEAEEVVKSLRKGLSDAGSAAVIATYVALGALIAALIDAIIGLIALIPPATPVGAGVITVAIGLGGAAIAGLIAFAHSHTEIIATAKLEIDGKLRSNTFPGGKWPEPTSKAIKSQIEDIEGWDYD